LIYFLLHIKGLDQQQMISYKSEADSHAELAASGQSKDCPEKDV